MTSTPGPRPPLRLRGPAELVAVVPHLLGHRPERSAVLVPMTGSLLSAPVVRADLPPPSQAPSPWWVDGVLSPLRSHLAAGGTAVLVVVEDGPAAQVELDRLALVEALVEGTTELGGGLTDVLRTGDGRWWSWWCGDPACCPPEGRPLEESAACPAAVGLVAAGSAPAASRDDLVADVATAADARVRARVARALPRCAPPRDDGPVLARWRHRALLAWEQAAARGARGELPASPAVLARLAGGLLDLAVRDAVLVLVDPAAPPGAAAGVLRGRRDALEDLWESPPDEGSVAALERVLAAVARCTTGEAAAAALAVLGWCAWWRGSGARASLLAERALAQEAGHRLAALVLQLAEQAVPPPWRGAA